MRKKLIMIGMILLVGIIILSIAIKLKSSYSMFSPSSQSYIDNMIVNKMKDDHIPGMSVLIVKNNKTILNKGYGFSNIKKKSKVTPNTRFEIASNTKAFTGYAMMQLVEAHKINLNDKVSQYIPGFYMKYNHKKVDITVDQLIAQTSGISGDITNDDNITKDTNSLEGLVHSIKGRNLDAKPGKQFEYSNMNYDILGLIVQKASHQSYANYLSTHLFTPLHMTQSTVKESNMKKNNDAQGYVIKKGKAYADSPEFNLGDNPAAYMMTNTKDLASWLKFQLNPPKKVASLVQLTHQPRVKAIDNSQDVHYAAGWFIDDNHSETIVYHPGTLENYSSYIILNPKKDYGIVVLANSYSKNVAELAQHLNIQMSNGQHIKTLQYLINQWNIVFIIITIILLIAVASVFLIIYRLIFKFKSIYFKTMSGGLLIKISMMMLTFTLILAILHLLPILLLSNSDWRFMMSWLPLQAKITLFSFVLLLTSLWSYFILKITTLSKRPI